MTNTSSVSTGTTSPSRDVKYESCEREYPASTEPTETQSPARDEVPVPYNRRVTVPASAREFPVMYNHKDAVRELAFIQANKTLEDQRN